MATKRTCKDSTLNRFGGVLLTDTKTCIFYFLLVRCFGNYSCLERNVYFTFTVTDYENKCLLCLATTISTAVRLSLHYNIPWLQYWLMFVKSSHISIKRRENRFYFNLHLLLLFLKVWISELWISISYDWLIDWLYVKLKK